MIAKLGELAANDVPLLHVCGSLDPALNEQSRVIEKRYKDLGGAITVVVNEGVEHYPLAPRHPKPVVDFIVAKAGLAASRPPGDAKPGRMSGCTVMYQSGTDVLVCPGCATKAEGASHTCSGSNARQR